MKHDPPITKPSDPTEADRDRDDANERARDRARRVSAEQMAAPSTRTWRRPARDSS